MKSLVIYVIHDNHFSHLLVYMKKTLLCVPVHSSDIFSREKSAQDCRSHLG